MGVGGYEVLGSPPGLGREEDRVAPGAPSAEISPAPVGVTIVLFLVFRGQDPARLCQAA